jgi:hypothetical protein
MANEFLEQFSGMQKIFAPAQKMAASRREKQSLEDAKQQSFSALDDFLSSQNIKTEDIDPNTYKALQLGMITDKGKIDPGKVKSFAEILRADTPESKLQSEIEKEKIKLQSEYGLGEKDLDIDGDGIITSQEIGQARQTAELSRKGKDLRLQSEKEVEAERDKKAVEQKRATLQANLMLARTQENFANMVNQQKKINPGFEPGRLGGVELLISGILTGQNPYAQTFVGDTVTTAIALGRIASPGARVGPQFIESMEKTLPNIFSTKKESIEQLVQSATDAYERSIVEDAMQNPEIYFDQGEMANAKPIDLLNKLRESSSSFREDFRGMMESIYSGKDFSVGSAKEKTIVFIDGDSGETYNIPSSKIEGFMRAKPNARRI